MKVLAEVRTEYYDYRNGTNLLAAGLLLVVGLFGVITNSSIIFIFCKNRSKRTSFNLICVFRAVSNIIILSTTFLGLFLPKTLLDDQLYPPALESWLIHISITLYLGNEYQIVLFALNRFYALFVPKYYSIICGFLPTTLFLILMYIHRVYRLFFEVPRPVFWTNEPCYSLYYAEYLGWMLDLKDGCYFNSTATQVMFGAFAAMILLNVPTLLRVIVFFCSRNQSMDEKTKTQFRKDSALFFQTILQIFVFLIEPLFNYVLIRLSNNRLWIFICYTLVWEFTHAIDGFLMLIFNRSLKPRSPTVPSVTPVDNYVPMLRSFFILLINSPIQFFFISFPMYHTFEIILDNILDALLAK